MTWAPSCFALRPSLTMQAALRDLEREVRQLVQQQGQAERLL